LKEKLLRWLLFSVLLSLSPLLARAISLSTDSADTNLLQLLSPRGELLLVSIVLCAAAAGELIGSKDHRRMAKITAGGISVLLLVFAALYFGHVYGADPAQALTLAPAAARTSGLLFASSVICSGCCVALTEG
jgi:hypothetical protein